MHLRRVFLYGTLRDHALLAAVLGRPAGPGDLAEAALPDHAAHRVVPGAYPVIRPEPGAVAPGLLLSGLTAEEVGRLSYYEGAFGYGTEPIEVVSGGTSVRALVFWPDGRHLHTDGHWDLARWQDEDRGLAAEAAREVMSEMGHRPAETVGARYAQIEARAQSRLAARAEAPPAEIRAGLGAEAVTLESRRRPYAGFFNVEEYELDLPAFGGGRLRPNTRSVFVAADAVTVLPYDPRRDTVLVLEQFRPGPYGRGDPCPWTLEPVAGRRDPGESVAETARRETREEAGIEIGALHHIGSYYPSPGCITEFLVSYVAEAALPDSAEGVHGLATEGENIRTRIVAFDRLMQAVRTGEAGTGPLLLSAYWLSLNRDRLRRAGGA